jgi:hypothetical protein
MSSICSERISFNELQDEKGTDIGYGDLLMTIEWCRKRNQIIDRDQRKCSTCNAEETIFIERGLHAKVKLILEKDPIEGFKYDAILEEADKPIILHVHHTYYVLDQLPWQYADDSLITLCHNCHNQLHQKETIPVYSSTGDLLAEISPCMRCNGSGYLPQYSHVQGGICFNCNGARYNGSLFTSCT